MDGSPEPPDVGLLWGQQHEPRQVSDGRLSKRLGKDVIQRTPTGVGLEKKKKKKRGAVIAAPR